MQHCNSSDVELAMLLNRISKNEENNGILNVNTSFFPKGACYPKSPHRLPKCWYQDEVRKEESIRHPGTYTVRFRFFFLSHCPVSFCYSNCRSKGKGFNILLFPFSLCLLLNYFIIIIWPHFSFIRRFRLTLFHFASIEPIRGVNQQEYSRPYVSVVILQHERRAYIHKRTYFNRLQPVRNCWNHMCAL